MKKGKNNFSKIKVSIFNVLFFILVFFFLGYLFSTSTQKKNEVDLSLIYDVWDILNKDFLDTRKEKEEEITTNDNIFGLASGLANSFKDPYTAFLPPINSAELKEDISGEFTGIGVEISSRNGLLTVVSPLPDTPAFKAGLRAKDVIVEIDGESSIDISAGEASKKIKGEKGTEVILKIARKNIQKLIDIKIIRNTINIPIIKTYNEDGVFIIKIFSFSENSPEEFIKAVRKFGKSKNKKLIIDLRNNPGGHLFAAVYIAGLFLPKDTLILSEEYKSGKKTNSISGDFHKNNSALNIFNDNVKIGVLVNGGSASASEILAGTLRDNERAVLLGENTYGKGTVQKVVNVGGGASLKYTVARWILPKGDWISEEGILVDIELSLDEKTDSSESLGTYDDNIDSQLRKAIVEIKKINSQKEIKNIIGKTLKREKEKKEKEKAEKINKIINN